MWIELYQYGIIYLMYLLFILFIFLVIINFKTIKKQFKLSRKTWLLLAAIFILGAIIRLFIFPHFHVMYVDEPLYMEMAKNMNQDKGPVVCEYVDFYSEKCYLPMKPPGWPSMISIFLRLFNPEHVLIFASIIGSLTIVLTFLLAYVITHKEKVALFSAVILSITPIHVMWSNSAETNMVSLLFMLACMLLYALYYRKNNKLTQYTLLICILISASIRIETVFLVGILYLHKRFAKTEYFYLVVIGYIIAVLPVEHIAVRFIRNHIVNGADYLLRIPDMAPLGLFLLVAGFSLYKIQDIWSRLLVSVTLFFSVFYLPILTESRFLLIPLVCLIIMISRLAGPISYGIIWGLIILLFMSLIISYGKIQDEHGSVILETEMIIDITQILPKDAVVLLEYPTILNSYGDFTAIPLNQAPKGDQSGNIYFLFDIYCSQWDVGGSKHRCIDFLLRNDAELIKTYQRGSITYRLFHLV